MAIAGAGGGLFLVDPLASPLFPPCPFRWATGLLCPGCGTLRGMHRLLNADLAGAWAMNPLMVVSLPFIGALLVRPQWGRKPWVPWAVFAVVMAYWVLRNIPVAPFSWMAPH